MLLPLVKKVSGIIALLMTVSSVLEVSGRTLTPERVRPGEQCDPEQIYIMYYKDSAC